MKGICPGEKANQKTSREPAISRAGTSPFASFKPENERPSAQGIERAAGFSHYFGDIDILPRPVVQSKLIVGPPGDKYEQEADRVANEVMSKQESGVPKILLLDGAKRSEWSRSSLSIVSQTPGQGLLQRYIPAEELADLDAVEQTAFMRQVYELQRQRSARGRAFVGDLPAVQLAEVENGVQARRDAAAACRMLLHAARDALRDDQRRGDRLAMQVRRIGIASGYRSAQRQFQNWREAFPRYYRQTQDERRRQPGGEHGEAAARLLARYISGRLAAPGYSLHNSGIAIDFSTTQGRQNLGPNTSQIAQWNSSWFFNWLNNNASNFGFAQNPNIIEPWHWELVGNIEFIEFSEQEALMSQATEAGNEGTEQGELVQPKPAGSKTCSLDSDLEVQLRSMNGGGKPLPKSTRNLFEPHFGHDFSGVRVHTDAGANNMARAMNARAFTTGQELFFGQGEFRPATFRGQWLLAHELAHVVQQSGVIGAHSVDVINRMPDDFSQTSSAGDTLEVTTEMYTDKGAVRMWAGPEIVSSEGDRLRYQCFARVINRPFQVTVGIRTIDVHDIVVQRVFPRSRLQRWQGSGILVLRPWSTTPGSGLEFFVSLIPIGAEPIEYSEPLQFDTSAVELSRVLNAEAGSSLAGMIAVAHVINNRLTSGSPGGQVDLSSQWPESFINTGFWLNRGRPRRNWPRVTSTASRKLARLIILDGVPPEPDPTGGAIFYRSAGRPDLETTSPAFRHLRQEVERGHLGRITIGGNVFYAPIIEP